MSTTENKIETVKKDLTASVLVKIQEFEKLKQLTLPADYSAENALKAAYIALQEVKTSSGKSALEACNPASIGNALLKMVVWGLSPLKKQCSFIAYGEKLECSVEYSGNIALAKRYGGLKTIKANVVYKDDVFEFETDIESGRKKIVKHTQTLNNFGKEIIGAYAFYELEDGTKDVEIMSMDQIKASWNQGAMKGNSPAHKNFPDQMAMKTVYNRACKLLIRSSNDSVLFPPSSSEEEEKVDKVSEDVKHEVLTNANRNPVDFPEAEIISETKTEEVKVEEQVIDRP